MQRRRLVMSVATMLYALAPAPVAAQHFPADEDLRLMLRYIVEDNGIPGIALGVLEADGTTRAVGWGSGGPDARPVGPRSVFEIGSINKTFTGTLLADMVMRGEVALEDPVSKYLPDSVVVPARNGHEITLLSLATHTSGLPRLPDNYTPPDMADPYADYAIETLYAFLSNHVLRRDPGVAYEYSNLGYGLLGHALARAANTTYRALLRERILDPLGMDMTAYALDGELAALMTQGHSNGSAVPYWFGTEAIDGAGGLRSNTEDMLKYLKANAGSPDSRLSRAMRMAQEPRVQREEGLESGFSWARRTTPGQPTVVMHSGGTGGFRAQIALDPERRIGTVLLTNTDDFAENLAVELLYPDPPPAEWRSVSEPADLEKYAGRYAGPSGSAYYIRAEPEDHLTYQPVGAARARLYARPDHSFYMLTGPWSIRFEQDGSGRVTGMLLHVDEREPAQMDLRVETRKVSDEMPPPADIAAGVAGTAWSGAWIWGAIALLAVLILAFFVHRRTRSGVIAAIVLVALAGCTPDSHATRRAVVDTLPNGSLRVRGPAGGAWTDAERWHLEEQVRIGRVEGGGADVFGQIWAITTDTLGRLYVLDRLAKEVRLFDTDGTHVRTFGREGSGPGEFADPFGFAWDAEGRLWVVDVRQSRYSVFTASGDHVREYSRLVGGFSWPWPGRFDRSGTLYEASFLAGGVRPIIAFKPAESLVATDTFANALASQRPGDFWNLQDERGIGAIVGIPHGRQSEWALDANGELWTGWSGAYSISRQSLYGDTILRIESEALTYPVTAAERAAAIETLGDYARHPRMDLSRIPSTKAFFRRLLPDDSGNLWVLREGEGDNWVFDVFAHDGTFLGTVDMPVRPELFPPPWIGRETMLVVTRDELDVQSILVFRIVRGVP